MRISWHLGQKAYCKEEKRKFFDKRHIAIVEVPVYNNVITYRRKHICAKLEFVIMMIF